jgi:hypothetical protein
MRWNAAHPLQLVLGPGVWFAWFNVAYGGLSVACSMAGPAAPGPVSWINGTLLALTLATAAALGLAAIATARAARRMPATASPRERFVTWVALGLYVISAVSTLMLGLPMAWLPPCV